MSDVQFLGQPLFSKNPDGSLVSSIVTIFPRFDTIVTIPTIHLFQIDAFIAWVNAQRLKAGKPRLDVEQEQDYRGDAVLAVIVGDRIQIRSDPQDMLRIFAADKLLQRAQVSKRQIKYLNVFNEQVREALKKRGELWRIARLPTRHEEIQERILAMKARVGGEPIYYYNATTGTRWLTLQEFTRLADLDDAGLTHHLEEIRRLALGTNLGKSPEVAFYMAHENFSGEAFEPYDFASLPAAELRASFESLRVRFRSAVPEEFHEDRLDDDVWRQRMFSALVTETDEVLQSEVLLSLSPEFFMQIHWLPGGRIRNGELTFDEVFEEDQQDPCEERAREFLFNLVREYGDLEYVNIGKVVNSLSRRNPGRGRREVYLAVVKRRGHAGEIVRVIRMQKWDVRQHLNEGLEVPQAMFRSDEYTEYVLDRRFACRYLGMNIPKQFTTRKICERYFPKSAEGNGYMIWSPYFERAYIHGVATDKTAEGRFKNPDFVLAFARLLGRAAASNIIVGRCDASCNTLFDDGDEIILEDEFGLPTDIVVADQTGTFGDYLTPLRNLAASYAGPVNRRLKFLPAPEAFARVYLDAFVERFRQIQEKYRLQRKAFDTLFKVRPYDEKGCFSHRWKCVLRRLVESDPRELAQIIRANLQISDGYQPPVSRFEAT
jgi:hypothetical protein